MDEKLLQVVSKLRRKFRERDDHHSLCSWQRDKPCDCYAKSDCEAHELLDEIERAEAVTQE